MSNVSLARVPGFQAVTTSQVKETGRLQAICGRNKSHVVTPQKLRAALEEYGL